MGNQRRFWGLVVRQAACDFWNYLKPTGGHIVLALVQIAIIYLVLYYTPGLGDLRNEVNGIALAAIAVLVVAALQLAYCIIAAPGRVHGKAADQSEALQVLLGRDADNDAVKAGLRALYEEGLTFYQNEGDFDLWLGFPPEWMARARAFVATHFTAEMLFEYDHNQHTPAIQKQVGIDYPVGSETDLDNTLIQMRRKLGQLSNLIHYPTKAEILRRDRETAGR